MTYLTGYYNEIQYRDTVYMDNARTLHDAADEEWFTVTVAAKSAVSIDVLQSSGARTVKYFQSDATTSATSRMENTTVNPMTFYVRLSGTDASGAWSVMGVTDLLQDLDGDSFYSRDWSDIRDCNDTDATIFPGTTEVDNDGLDQDCGGSDNTAARTLLAPEKVRPK